MNAADFPTTRWSVIHGAEIGGPASSVEAMNVFVRLYWKPIFYFLRARGIPLIRAEDLTQEFMLRLMEEDWLRRADEDRGRFRNFILRVLVRFVADQGPSRTTRQKSFEGGLTPISSLLREEDRSYEPVADETAEDVFDRRWAMSLLESVRELVELSYRLEKKESWWKMFVARYLAEPGSRRPSEQELAVTYNLSRDQVRHALQQAKTRFLQLLKTEVRGQMGDEDPDAAVREILALAARYVPSE